MEATMVVKRLRPEALLPRYAHDAEEDAGLDLSYAGAKPLTVPPWGRATCPTGLAIELHPGFEGQVRPRSGLALTHGVTVLNAPGTVDPGFRGELAVILINLSDEPYTIEPGDRIAQLVVSEYAKVQIVERDDLDPSRRDHGGFGSTGDKSAQ